MNERILIADDSLFSRAVVKYILNNAGYSEISESTTGEEAVSSYIRLHPDLVIMDLIMPGKNGLEALADIIKSDPKAKVIIASSVGDEKVIFKAIQAGAIDYIVKPFVRTRLLISVQRALYRLRR